MSKTIEKAINIFLKAKEAMVVLAAIFLWFLGIWLSSRLAPIVDDIKITENRVNAIENQLDFVENNCIDEIDNIEVGLHNLSKKVDDNFKTQSAKLDNIYNILIKEL